MKCAVCGNEMVKKKFEIDLRIQERLYLMRNASYEECQSFGEKVISREKSKILYEKIQDKELVEQFVRIPVLDGTYA